MEENDNEYLEIEEEYGGIFLKVMTDEQIEVLGKQIAAYSTISEQLEELHRTLVANHDDHFAVTGGGGFGTMMMGRTSSSAYPLIGCSSQNKLSRRQRWNPTSDQFRILERVFDQEGIRTPNPQKVKEIANELAIHGQISEPNVYNWFQNRRARLKKKKMLEAETNNNNNSNNINGDESAGVEEDGREINIVSPENALPRTMTTTSGGGILLPAVHSLHDGCIRRRPSEDFAEMAAATQGRMSCWEEGRTEF